MNKRKAARPDDSELPLLVIPEWLKWSPVIESAKYWERELQRDKEPRRCLEVLHRVVCDPRMKAVWTELFKRNRADGSYFYAANPEGLRKVSAEVPEFATADDAQDFAVKIFFNHAFSIAAWPVPATTVPQVRKEMKILRGIIRHLTQDSRRLESIGMADDAADLAGVARHCALQLQVKTGDNPFLLRKARGNSDLRFACRFLANMTRRAFGKPMYKTLATTLTVVFAKSVTPEQVREELR